VELGRINVFASLFFTDKGGKLGFTLIFVIPFTEDFLSAIIPEELKRSL